MAWVSRLRAALAEPPAESPSTRKISVPIEDELEQSASLPGRRSLRVAVLRCCSRSCRRRRRSSALATTCSSRTLPASLSPVSQCSKLSPTIGLDELGGLDADQLFLGLALELRLLDEDRDEAGGAVDHVVGGDDRALAVAGQLGIALEAAHQRAAEARFVRAALGRRHGVAVGADEAFLVVRPPHRPFDLAAGRCRCCRSWPRRRRAAARRWRAGRSRR